MAAGAGAAVAVGRDCEGQTALPELPEGLKYRAAAAGGNHTVLVREDGFAFCFGSDCCGQLCAPALEDE